LPHATRMCIVVRSEATSSVPVVRFSALKLPVSLLLPALLRRVPVRSRRRGTRLRFSRRVVNSLCRLAKPVSPSPEALHNRAANQGFLLAVLATPSFSEGRAIFFAGNVVFLLRVFAFTRFALAVAGTEGPALAAL